MKSTKIISYKPRIRLKSAWIFIFSFIMFPVMGVFAFLSGAEVAGVIMFSFGTVVIIIILYKVSALDKKYLIGNDSIVVQNMYTRLHIGFREINSVSYLDEDSFRKLLYLFYSQVMEAEKNSNLKEWCKASRRYRKLQRFVSIININTVITKGNSRAISGYKVNSFRDAVLICLNTKENILITPKNSKGYINDLTRYGVENISPDPILEKLSREINDGISEV